MPDSNTGERVTDVLNLPSRAGLVVNAVRVDYEPGGLSRAFTGTRPGAYVYVIAGSVVFGIDDREPVVLKAGTRSTSRRARCTPCRAMPARSLRRA